MLTHKVYNWRLKSRESSSLLHYIVRCRIMASKVENLHACFFLFFKVCLRAQSVCCYFVHAKIAIIYACIESVYIVSIVYDCTHLMFNTEHSC